MTPDEVCVVLCTVPSREVAETLARTAVDARLAACVNVVPSVTSIYRWEGKVTSEAEVLLVCKTVRGRVEALMTALRARHPYTLPELIVLPVTGGHAPYLDWVRSETAGGGTG